MARRLGGRLKGKHKDWDEIEKELTEEMVEQFPKKRRREELEDGEAKDRIRDMIEARDMECE